MYLGYIILSTQWKNVRLLTSWPLWPPDVGQSMCGHGHKNCLPQLILTDFYIASMHFVKYLKITLQNTAIHKTEFDLNLSLKKVLILSIGI